MALPPDINTVTVTGTYTGGDGLPEAGAVTFLPTVDTVRDPASDQVVKLGPQHYVLDAAGHFAATLVASNDPDIVPSGWYYTVVERITGKDQRTWLIEVPYTLLALDLADIPEVTDPSSPTYPLPVTGVTSVVGHNGDVTGAEIIADATVSAALAARVPYTGATADVDLGAHSLTGENVNVNEGTLTDPTIVDLGGLAISVSSVDCLIRSDGLYGNDGHLYRATIPAVASMALTDNAVNHLYATWNSGSPVYGITTNRSILNLSDVLPVARLNVMSGAVHSKLVFGFMGRSAGIRWLLREVRITYPVGGVHESGLGVTETATRVVHIGAGTAWFVLNHLVLDGIAQGGAGVTSYLLHHTAGNWVRTSISQYNNTQYDNGTNLATLTNNRYAVNWVYRSLANEEIIIILGTGDYFAADAVSSSVPAAPQYISEFYYLCGRIIVQKNASSAYLIENTTTTQFGTGTVTDHNDLDGLQGGASGEYYHLTAAQHTALGVATSVAAGTPAGGGAPGTAGQILYDATRLYICTATNTWKYVALTAL
jgi:hypothetical protein